MQSPGQTRGSRKQRYKPYEMQSFGGSLIILVHTDRANQDVKRCALNAHAGSSPTRLHFRCTLETGKRAGFLDVHPSPHHAMGR